MYGENNVASNSLRTAKAKFLSDRAFLKAQYNIRQFWQLKKITAVQHSDDRLNSARYDSMVKWYGVMCDVMQRWHDEYPTDLEAVSAILGIGMKKIPLSVTEASIKYHMSASTLYKLKASFTHDVAIVAAQRGLIW